MKPGAWFRSLSVLFSLFALGHTLGTFSPRVTHGEPEAQVFAAMQSFRFHVMGFDRTYWDFYRGFAITISALLVMMTAMAWQIGTLAGRDPARARPLALSMLFGSVSFLVTGWQFFFGVPIAMSTLAVVLSLGGVLSLNSPRNA